MTASFHRDIALRSALRALGVELVEGCGCSEGDCSTCGDGSPRAADAGPGAPEEDCRCGDRAVAPAGRRCARCGPVLDFTDEASASEWPHGFRFVRPDLSVGDGHSEDLPIDCSSSDDEPRLECGAGGDSVDQEELSETAREAPGLLSRLLADRAFPEVLLDRAKELTPHLLDGDFDLNPPRFPGPGEDECVRFAIPQCPSRCITNFDCAPPCVDPRLDCPTELVPMEALPDHVLFDFFSPASERRVGDLFATAWVLLVDNLDIAVWAACLNDPTGTVATRVQHHLLGLRVPGEPSGLTTVIQFGNVPFGGFGPDNWFSGNGSADALWFPATDCERANHSLDCGALAVDRHLESPWCAELCRFEPPNGAQPERGVQCCSIIHVAASLLHELVHMCGIEVGLRDHYLHNYLECDRTNWVQSVASWALKTRYAVALDQDCEARTAPLEGRCHP